ncbi:MAG TPA: glutathione S-transferase family protein, partial [Brevundimonas sp.]|nr:glutathione S-transferase family protein [Brevundimonas sp.]
MEPILLYGFPSGTSMGLVAALEWLGRPYRLCRVDMLGEMREPGYARLNARHETPVLITDAGRPLSETMAIAAWLEARDADRRVSFDPLSPEADRMHQLMAFLNTGFTGAFSPLWVAFELPTPDPDYEQALRRFGRDAVIERHDKLEAMVGDGPYLVGDRPCLADALLAGVGRWLEFHE